MQEIYPLKFESIFQERIWGGQKLSSHFNKTLADKQLIGESWELSTVEENYSEVVNGFLSGNDLKEIIEVYMGDLLGEQCYEKFGDEFPLLFKLIDAQDILSLQVHPDDQTAKKLHRAYGKSEMWYIIDAEPGSKIINGFSEDINEDIFVRKLHDGTLSEVLQEIEVKAGDVFYIPAGRIHAIGKGILLAEIQQSSDVTYRIYDWGRTDSQGKSRELHTDLALSVIDYQACTEPFSQYQAVSDKSVNLVKCDKFITNLIQLNDTIHRDFEWIDSFVVYFCIEGEVILTYPEGKEKIKAGECLLIPATIRDLHLKAIKPSKILEVYLPE